jgi:hypothetical protein
MSGQSAHMSLKEARAMQERIQVPGTQAACSSKKGASETPMNKKVAHQG